MKFRTRFTEKIKEKTPAGEPFRQIYRQIIKDGFKDLVPDHLEDTKEKIQEGFEETLVKNIIARYTRGDISALERNRAYYEDITNAPQSLLEAHQMITNAQELFDLLPADLKQKFDYNIEKFFTEEGMTALDQYTAAKTKTEVSPVPEIKPEGEKNEI